MINELETLFQTKRETLLAEENACKKVICDNTYEANALRDKLVEKLSFLKNHGAKSVEAYRCGVAVEITFNGKNGTYYDVKISVPCHEKVMFGKTLRLYNIESPKFLVNWNCNVCHSERDSFLTLEEIVNEIAKKI